jgi:hypothetical protein
VATRGLLRRIARGPLALLQRLDRIAQRVEARLLRCELDALLAELVFDIGKL